MDNSYLAQRKDYLRNSFNPVGDENPLTNLEVLGYRKGVREETKREKGL